MLQRISPEIALGRSYGFERGWLEVAAPPGKNIYAFHAPSADVTVIRAGDGAIVEKIAVEGLAMGTTRPFRLTPFPSGCYSRRVPFGFGFDLTAAGSVHPPGWTQHKLKTHTSSSLTVARVL